MTEYRDQGEGELVPGRGFEIVKILIERRGTPTAIDFDDGTTITTHEAAYGRDIGEEWEHLYLEVPGQTLFTSSSSVSALRDPETGVCLFQRCSPS